VPKPKLSNENLIINELIREYFEYNGYRHALSVFLPGWDRGIVWLCSENMRKVMSVAHALGCVLQSPGSQLRSRLIANSCRAS
jgi:hypothetical protein